MTSHSSLAARVHAYGEAIQLDPIAPAPAGPFDVLVQTTAVGINPIDWKVRDGQRRERMPLELPAVIGCDIAGLVIAKGAQVQDLEVGQRVFGMVGLHGGFQSVVAVATEHMVAIPEGMSDEEAASIPLAALTAYQALELAQARRGERILVHAAAGGVGGFAVQLARARGMEVIATASEPKHEYVRSLGAAQCIDYRNTAFESACEPVDVVLDLIGGDTQRRSWQLLRAGGRLITSVMIPEPGQDGRPADSQAARVGVRPNGKQLAEIAALYRQGKFRTHVESVLPFAQVQEALERNRLGHAQGKTVLRVQPV